MLINLSWKGDFLQEFQHVLNISKWRLKISFYFFLINNEKVMQHYNYLYSMLHKRNVNYIFFPIFYYNKDRRVVIYLYISCHAFSNFNGRK